MTRKAAARQCISAKRGTHASHNATMRNVAPMATSALRTRVTETAVLGATR